MTRIAPKLLTALFVLGCGSGAMADNTGGYQTTPTQSVGTGDQNQPSQSGYPPPSSYPQGYAPRGSYPPAYSSPAGYQDQGASQPPDQEEDTGEPETLEAGQSHLGIMVMGLTSELRRFFGVAGDRGVLIARVEPSSAAARAGIQVGDVLVRVGSQVVRSGDEVTQALAACQGGRVRILVIRQGRPVHLVAVLPISSNNQPGTQNNPPGNQNNPPIGPPQNQL